MPISIRSVSKQRVFMRAWVTTTPLPAYSPRLAGGKAIPGKPLADKLKNRPTTCRHI
jgi:hypothetical protein